MVLLLFLFVSFFLFFSRVGWGVGVYTGRERGKRGAARFLLRREGWMCVCARAWMQRRERDRMKHGMRY